MNAITIGAAALNQTPIDWENNFFHISTAIEAARAHGVRLLCLPELAVTGYGCEDLFHAPFVLRTSHHYLERIAPLTAGMFVVVGAPLATPEAVWNCAYVLSDGRIVGIVPKQKLAGDGLHYEYRWFKPWPRGATTTLPDGIPFGDLVFDVDGVRVGIEVCEDAWVADRPLISHVARGVDVICNPSASHFALDKHLIRRRYVAEGSRMGGAVYVLANLVGCESGRTIFDGHCCIAYDGAITAESALLRIDRCHLTVATVNIASQRVRRWSITSTKPVLPKQARSDGAPTDAALTNAASWDSNVIACCTGALRSADGAQRPAPSPKVSVFTTPQPDLPQGNQFAAAASLGLIDYLIKSRSNGYVVSLSGGADSSTVAILVAIAAHRIAHHMDENQSLVRLFSPHLKGIFSSSARIPTPVADLLWCVYQKTAQNSRQTYTSARSLAEALGAHFESIDIDHVVDSYIELGSKVLGRKLNWRSDDTTLQNIQSRTRSPLIWMIANARNALLLTTGNRSECSVGYFTMDGDSSGGLNPLAGVSKSFIRQWLLELQGNELLLPDAPPFGPLPNLSKVNTLSPSAELRPLSAGQTDEADLMPYPLLTTIEAAFLANKMSPLEIWQDLLQLPEAQNEASSLDSPLLAEQIGRFFQLWATSQWKRERCAPSFHIDRYNVDPRSWCRFPILSGNFLSEIAELRLAAQTMNGKKIGNKTITKEKATRVKRNNEQQRRTKYPNGRSGQKRRSSK